MDSLVSLLSGHRNMSQSFIWVLLRLRCGVRLDHHWGGRMGSTCRQERERRRGHLSGGLLIVARRCGLDSFCVSFPLTVSDVARTTRVNSGQRCSALDADMKHPTSTRFSTSRCPSQL